MECRDRMSLYQDSVLYYVLYHGLASLLCNSSPAGSTVPALCLPTCVFCYQQKCWGFLWRGLLDYTAVPGQITLTTEMEFPAWWGSHAIPTQTRMKVGKWTPRKKSSMVRRGKGYWVGKTWTVPSRSLQTWSHWSPLFVLSPLENFPNSLPCCLTLPPLPLNISTKWLLFNSEMLGINHMFGVFMEIIQGDFLKHWHLRMIFMQKRYY